MKKRQQHNNFGLKIRKKKKGKKVKIHFDLEKDFSSSAKTLNVSINILDHECSFLTGIS